MINIPFKRITLNKDEFTLSDINHPSPSQYNFNTELEIYIKIRKFKIITIKLPEDCEVECSRYFTIYPIMHIPECSRYSITYSTISFLGEYDNWYALESISFGYFYLTPELKENRSRIKKLNEDYDRIVAELNGKI